MVGVADKGTIVPAMPPRKRIVKAIVQSLSLCKAGKNYLSVVYKSKEADGQDRVSFVSASKASSTFAEDGLIYAIGYLPEHEDADRERADPKVVQEMAHSFAANGFALDIEHDGKKLPREAVHVVENLMIQPGDQRFAGIVDTQTKKSIDPAYGWGVILKVQDENLRKLYREGQWGGVSFGGLIAVEEIQANKSQEQDMTPEQIQALATAVATAVGTQMTTALKAILPPAPPSAEEVTAAEALLRRAGKSIAPVAPTTPPAVPRNPFSLADVRARKSQLLREAALKDIDWNDLAQVTAFEEALVAENIDEPTSAPKSSLPQSALKALSGSRIASPTGDDDLDDASLYRSTKSLAERYLGVATSKN